MNALDGSLLPDITLGTGIWMQESPQYETSSLHRLRVLEAAQPGEHSLAGAANHTLSRRLVADN